MNELRHKWKDEWMNEWMNELIGLNGWTDE